MILGFRQPHRPGLFFILGRGSRKRGLSLLGTAGWISIVWEALSVKQGYKFSILMAAQTGYRNFQDRKLFFLIKKNLWNEISVWGKVVCVANFSARFVPRKLEREQKRKSVRGGRGVGRESFSPHSFANSFANFLDELPWKRLLYLSYRLRGKAEKSPIQLIQRRI